jgi:hypothetical protein
MKQASQSIESSVSSDSKELLSLCRAGRLYEVEKWIVAGKSLELPVARNARKKTLLQVAVETGFHSLVELIARHDTSKESKNSALATALSQSRLDLIELLVENGAEISSVPFADVLLNWEPKIIQYFLGHDADILTDSPFAQAFGAKVRTALRPFLECKRAHPELTSALQEQLDCALRYFCSEADLKWVSLLIWAGGDVRSLGPCLNKDYTTDPESFTSGLSEAGYSGNVDLIKKLKPDPARDNLSELLHNVALFGSRDALNYLLEIGANPNGKPNGGSSALDAALWRLDPGPVGCDGFPISRFGASEALGCIGELLAHGAVWNPEPYQMISLRKALIRQDSSVTIDLLQLFRKHSSCPAALIHKLLDTPKMREHLASQSWQLNRLGLSLGSVK